MIIEFEIQEIKKRLDKLEKSREDIGYELPLFYKGDLTKSIVELTSSKMALEMYLKYLENERMKK